MRKDKAIVVFSGGQDSTTCLFWAKKNFKEVVAVSFDYNQKHIAELECAKDIAAELGVEHHILDMKLLAQLAPNALTRSDIEIQQGEDGAPPTLNLAMDYQFVIHTPIMWIDKAETWKLADDLSALDFIREKTLTCYNGIIGEGCGECPSCILRKRGLDNYLKSKNIV